MSRHTDEGLEGPDRPAESTDESEPRVMTDGGRNLPSYRTAAKATIPCDECNDETGVKRHPSGTALCRTSWPADEAADDHINTKTDRLMTDGGVTASESVSDDQMTNVYLGKVSNVWGRGDELVAGSMDQAKADIEARARELASFLDDADLPDEADWRAHSVEDGTQVWDVNEWQIVVQTHQIAKQSEVEA